MGISMSVTAFPVLARILNERGLNGTPLGNTAITCAAVGDVTAWCVLAFVIAASGAGSALGSVATLAMVAAFVAVCLLAYRPLMQRLADGLADPSEPGHGPVLAALLGAFVCALATEAIGVHALFGAFVAGIAMPTQEAFRKFVRERIEYFSTVFLLPVFFAFTGLRTEVGLISGGDWLVFCLILGLAVVGKLGGAALAARISGSAWRESFALGVLMNTRGLMELIVLNIGLDMGVLSPKVFTMLVLMALVTTFATGPLLALLGYGGARKVQTDEAVA
jgi:Kef-type K+ transport system membrane component KefB